MKTSHHPLTGRSQKSTCTRLCFSLLVVISLYGGNAVAEIGDPGDDLSTLLSVDTKTYHGSECLYIDLNNANSPEYYNNPVKYDTHGVYNQDAGSTHVVCPIVRDNTRNTDGTLGAKVYVNNVASRELWCELNSRDHYGDLIDEDLDSTTSGGNRTLSLDVDASHTLGNYSIYCHLPIRARIYSYRVTEFTPTDQ